MKLALDNTSILQLIADRFGSPGESYSPEVLGRKEQGIQSVSAVLDAAAGNTGICKLRAAATLADPVTVHNSDLRQGFDKAIRDLAARHGTEALAKYPELRGYLAS